MLEFFFAYITVKAIKFLLLPSVFTSLFGVAVAFQYRQTPAPAFKILAVFVLAGILLQIFDSFFQALVRDPFLSNRVSVEYRYFPREINNRDLGLYWITYLPALLLFFLIFYSGFRFGGLLKSPSVAAFTLSLLCTLATGANALILPPSWSPNGPLPLPEKKFPIHEAVLSGDLENVRKLISKGADVNRPTNKKMTPLIFAIENRNYEIIRALVEGGARVNDSGGDFKTRSPLMFAAGRGDLKTIEYLISKGASLNATTGENYNVLYYSLRQPRIFQWFLEQGVNDRLKDIYGESLLTFIAGMEDDFRPSPYAAPLVRLLLSRGFPYRGLPGEPENAPFYKAVRNQNIEVARIFLKKGVHPDEPDRKGCSPLMTSIKNLNAGMVQLLLEFGASPDLKSRPEPGLDPVLPEEYLQKHFKDSFWDQALKSRHRAVCKALRVSCPESSGE